MKTIYRCDVCGKEFAENWEECHQHEKACEEIHSTGIRLTRELNFAISTAEECGGVKIVLGFGEDKAYALHKAKYNARAKVIVVEIDTDDSYSTVKNDTEGGDNE